MSKVWFITGSSKGFGRVWAEAALERGDRVAATARNADTLTPLVEAYGDNVLAAPARRQRQGGDRRRGRAGARALRPPRRRRQQRRLRAVRRDRGADRGAGAPADRDQPVRPAVGHAGRAPDHARAGLRPHHPGLVDRRRERVPDPRALPRVEVGPGGLQPVARGRGRRASASRSRSSSPPASRPTGAARRRSSAEQMAEYDAVRDYRARLFTGAAGRAGRPAGHRLGDPRARRRRRAAAARVLRHRHAGHDPRPSTTKRIENWERWDHIAVAAQGGVTTS